MGPGSLESILVGMKPRPQPKESLKCPRCDSTNTKFCYYNNYSLSQPRYFCKSCCRYWTKGGTLRNVPVGRGCRKKKRVPSSKRNQDLHFVNPSADRSFRGLVNSFDSSNLALAIARLQKQDATNSNNNDSDGPHHISSDNLVLAQLDQGEYNVGTDIGIPRLGLLDGNFHSNLGNSDSGNGNYDHVLAMKQELPSGENPTLFRFPSHDINGMNVGGMMNIIGDDVDSGRSSSLASLNGELNSSSWHHGLLNSIPLM